MAQAVEPRSDRTGFIGGSDAAAVLGLSRWKTPLQVWAEKTGNVIPEDRSGDLPIRVGKQLEDLVANLFCEETGKKVRRVSESAVHPEHSFLTAQIDRRIIAEEEILECKTASGWKAAEWEDNEVPQEYVIQCLHQLGVMPRMRRAHLACLIGGNQLFVTKTIERDDALIQEIINKEVNFWHTFIVPKVMPIVTGRDAGTLAALFPIGHEGDPLELDGVERFIETMRDLERQADELNDKIETHKNGIRAMLKDAAVATAGRFKITWKSQTTTRLDLDRIKQEAPKLYKKFGKTSDTRVLRISENKKK